MSGKHLLVLKILFIFVFTIIHRLILVFNSSDSHPNTTKKWSFLDFVMFHRWPRRFSQHIYFENKGILKRNSAKFRYIDLNTWMSNRPEVFLDCLEWNITIVRRSNRFNANFQTKMSPKATFFSVLMPPELSLASTLWSKSSFFKAEHSN